MSHVDLSFSMEYKLTHHRRNLTISSKGRTVTVRLILRPLLGPLYQPRIKDEYGAISRMRIGKGNRSTRRKPAPVLFRPPQISHDLT
jgi:hypothetical protein